jgi:hypothetical protein
MPEAVNITLGDDLALPNCSQWQKVFQTWQRISRKASAEFTRTDASYIRVWTSLEQARAALVEGLQARHARDVANFSVLLKNADFKQEAIKDLRGSVEQLKASKPSASDVGMLSIANADDAQAKFYNDFHRSALGHLDNMYGAVSQIGDRTKSLTESDNVVTAAFLELAGKEEFSTDKAPSFQSLVAHVKQFTLTRVLTEAKNTLLPNFSAVWKLFFAAEAKSLPDLLNKPA